MKRCRICGSAAAVNLKAYRISLCENCYTSFYERRVEDSIKRYEMIRRGESVLVAVSGGKDSVALVSVMRILSKTFDFEFHAFYIDLGIKDYSDKALNTVRNLCKKLDVKLDIVRLSDYGFTIQDVNTAKVCSVCGNAKRYIMNRFARENGFDAIATGHNADDILINFFKNWLSGNKSWTDKQGPRNEGFKGMVTRIRPLFLRTEKENAMYVKIKKFPVLSEKCPNTKIDRWKEIIDEIEDKIPGFKQNFVRNIFAKDKQENITFKRCSSCGEPTSSDVCQFCRNVMRYGKILR